MIGFRARRVRRTAVVKVVTIVPVGVGAATETNVLRPGKSIIKTIILKKGWNNCRIATFLLLFFWLTVRSIKIVIDYNSTTLLKILTAQNCVVYAKRV